MMKQNHSTVGGAAAMARRLRRVDFSSPSPSFHGSRRACKALRAGGMGCHGAIRNDSAPGSTPSCPWCVYPLSNKFLTINVSLGSIHPFNPSGSTAQKAPAQLNQQLHLMLIFHILI